MTSYDDFECILAEDFIKQLNRGDFISKNVELDDYKAKLNYNDFVTKVIASKPTEHFVDEFESITEDDFLTIFCHMAFLLYGNHENDDTIGSYLKILHTNKSNKIFNGITLIGEDNETGEKIYFSEAPALDKQSGLICAVHEFMHYIAYTKNIDINKKMYYGEILSIFAELYTANSFSAYENISKDKDILNKIIETRLESISWHYTEGPNEIKEALKIHDILKAINPNSEGCKEVEQRLGYIVKPENRKNYFMYLRFIAESYGFGFIYGNALYNYSLEDYKTLSKKLNSLYKNEISLQDLLDYYNISLRDKKTLKLADDAIKIKTH